jgi:hypothetical protein
VDRSVTSRIAVARHAWLLGILVVAVYALLQLTAGAQWFLYPDSYRYARAAEQFDGASRAQAHRDALDAFCTTRADATRAIARLSPVPGAPLPAGTMTAQQCLARWASAADVTTTDPRYQAIFSSRPGYPLLAAPFVKLLGVIRGMRILGLLTAAGGSLLVVGLLRSAGLPPSAAVCGQLVFLATPLAQWSLQALSEGLVTICALGAIWGAVLLTRRRPIAGTPVLAASLAALAVTRYSSALMLAALTAAAAVAVWCGLREHRHRWTALLAGLSAVAAAVTAVLMSALALPSATTTLQDTFTKHFSRPDVSAPWQRLADLDARYWAHWIGGQALLPTFLVPTLVGVWALYRYRPDLGWFALATALTGTLQVAAHPLVQEADRLGVLMWMPAILGLPLLVARAQRHGAPTEPAVETVTMSSDIGT